MLERISRNLDIITHPIDSVHKFLDGTWLTLMDGLGVISFFIILLSLLLWQMGWDEGAKKIGFPALIAFILTGVFS